MWSSHSKLSKKLLLGTLLCHSPLVAFAGNQLMPNFKNEVMKEQISTQYDPKSLLQLNQVLQKELLTRIESAPTRKKKEKFEQIQKWAEGQMLSLNTPTGSSSGDSAVYANLFNVLYGIRSNDIEQNDNLGDTLKKVGEIVKGQISLPFIPAEKWNQPLPSSLLEKESSPLVDLKSGKVFSRGADLKGLNIQEIAELDVLASNPMFYSRPALQEIKKSYGSAWNYLEKKLEAEISKNLNLKYELNKARRILFFDEIKTSATSAKINAKDLFNQNWKVKWSEEIHSEPIANHLAIEIGAKYADPVYANSMGARDLILILETQKDGGISSLESLRKELLASKYNFDIQPFVSSAGTITEENIKTIAANFDLNSVQTNKLLGRNYVTFKESLVEFQGDHDSLNRIGAIPLSQGPSLNDRAKRSFALFSYWIQNKDAKDDNSRSILVDNEYFEFFHDLGASLAGIASSANPNQVEDSFLDITSIPDQISLQHRVLYVPKAFRLATTADLLWMAKRISSLTSEELKVAIQSSHWPEFQMDAMYSRLVSRRNQISTIFGLGSNIPLLKDGPVVRSLESPLDRLLVVKEYKIDVGFNGDALAALAHLEQVMTDSGATFSSNGISSIKTDRVLKIKNGIGSVSTCEESIIIAALESSSRPTGLGRRMKRSNDQEGLVYCYPGRKR